MTPVPVIAELSSDHRDAHPPHHVEPAVEIPNLDAFARNVLIRTTGVEPARDAALVARTREKLCQEVRMHERMAEDLLARLVEVLAVDEDHHAGRRVGRELVDPRVAGHHESSASTATFATKDSERSARFCNAGRMRKS